MGHFPKTHLVTVTLLVGVVSAFAALHIDTSDETQRVTTSDLLDQASDVAMPGDIASLPVPTTQRTTKGVAISSLPSREPELPDLEVTMERVAPGDYLEAIFKRNDIPVREMQRILDSGPLASRLQSIYPGHELAFYRDAEQNLAKLEYSPGPLETLEFQRRGDRFEAREVVQNPRAETHHRHGVIDHSLFVASQRIGLNDEITLRLAQIFQWDIDFVLDIRKGDEFHILYNELYLRDEFIGYGEILAAEFINQGQSYKAARYVDEAGTAGYFSPEGKNMKKAFLRAPVHFSRISSNFNLKRVHPLWKKAMPHRGIDYAAPTGTPILSAGDGRVTTAGRSRANGNFIVIKHGEQFQTKYLHLSKFARGVRKGQKVSQGQTIGYVGATGWATGPHLHYEFLVNGLHKNPRTVELPDAEPVPEAQLTRFIASVTPALEMLEERKEQQTELALAD